MLLARTADDLLSSLEEEGTSDVPCRFCGTLVGSFDGRLPRLGACRQCYETIIEIFIRFMRDSAKRQGESK